MTNYFTGINLKTTMLFPSFFLGFVTTMLLMYCNRAKLPFCVGSTDTSRQYRHNLGVLLQQCPKDILKTGFSTNTITVIVMWCFRLISLPVPVT